MNLESIDLNGLHDGPPAGYPLDRALVAVIGERVRNRKRWGEQNYPSITPVARGAAACHVHEIPDEARAKYHVQRKTAVGRLTWADVLLEEFAEAVGAPDEAARRGELVQVAAVALAWIECIDRRAAANQEVHA